MTDFPALLSRFTKAVAANDGAAFSGLFTEDGVYDDGFFGEYKGRKAIAEMLQHFHDTGSNYRWDFLDPLSDGHQLTRAIASLRVGHAGLQGRPVVFEGTSHFTFRDGLISRYEENFDRGMALAQQDFAAERMKEVLLKLADRQNGARGRRSICGGSGERLRPLPLVAKTAPFPAVIWPFRRRAAVAQW